MPNINGAIYFSSKSFERNPNGWNDSLRNNYYRYPALIPAMSWIDASLIEKPVLSVSSSGTAANTAIISIQNKETIKKIKAFVVYGFDKQDALQDSSNPRNIVKIIPATADTVQYSIPQAAGTMKKYGISAIDFENNESQLSFWP